MAHNNPYAANYPSYQQTFIPTYIDPSNNWTWAYDPRQNENLWNGRVGGIDDHTGMPYFIDIATERHFFVANSGRRIPVEDIGGLPMHDFGNPPFQSRFSVMPQPYNPGSGRGQRGRPPTHQPYVPPFRRPQHDRSFNNRQFNNPREVSQADTVQAVGNIDLNKSKKEQEIEEAEHKDEPLPKRPTEEEMKIAWSAIEKTKDELRNDAEISSKEPDKAAVDFPRRDKTPVAKKKTVKTNHYRLQIDPNVTFYEYEMIDVPRGINRTVMRKLFEDAMDSVPFLRNGAAKLATDHIKTIIAWENLHENANSTTDPIREGNGDVATLFGPYQVPYGRPTAVKPNPTHAISIRLHRKHDFQSLRTYVAGLDTTPRLWESAPEVKALNILLSKCFESTGMRREGANEFFDNNSGQMLHPADKSPTLCTSLFTLRGYFYTIKPVRGGIMLNINSTTKAFYQPQLLSDYLSDTNTIQDVRKRRETLIGARVKITYGRGNTQDARTRDLNYEVGRIKTISSVGGLIRDQTFRKTTNGAEADEKVVKHLKDNYSIELSKPDLLLPAINLGSAGNKSWFSATTLQLLPQVYRKVIPDELAEGMLSQACNDPENNVNWIQNTLFDEPFLRYDKNTNDGDDTTGESDKTTGDSDETAGYGDETTGNGDEGTVEGKEVTNSRLKPLTACPPLSIEPWLVEVPGSTIRYPEIRYKFKHSDAEKKINLYAQPAPKGAKGPTIESPRWNLRDCEFLKTKGSQVTVRPILLLAPGLDQNGLLGTQKVYGRNIKNFLWDYSYPNLHRDGSLEIPLDGTNDAHLRDGLTRAMNHQTPKDQVTDAKIIFLILPRKDSVVYQSFKRMADCELGIHAICLTESANVGKKDLPDYKRLDDQGNPAVKAKKGEYLWGLPQYFANIMMKVNLKFGGINHSTDNVKAMMKNTLVLGADVTHPGPNAIQGCPSIAAIVGSVDEDGGKFLGSMRLQSKDKTDREMIDEVEAMTRERLRDWSETHEKKLPGNILYYRDGVSEGQFMKVKRIEVAAIENAFKAAVRDKGLDSKTEVNVTAVVAAKRHHTRFYPKDDADKEGRAKNCQPGTLVDDEVTSPYFEDFYLQSHSGLLGTARPTRYFVLQNGMGMTMQGLQQFTHELCYTYVRATIGVSYASPAYYADRLCERGRAYIREYMVGDPTIRKELNTEKSRIERDYNALKGAMFGPRDRVKSEDELIFDGILRQWIARDVRDWTMSRVVQVWGGLDRNPWKDSLNGSMFWM